MTIATLPALPGVTEPTLIVIVLLMLVGGMFFGVMAHCIWTAPKQGPDAISWTLGIVFVAGFLALDIWNDHRAEVLDTALITEAIAADQQITLRLDDCGPPADGLTDQIVMTIEAKADRAPRITGCHRIAHRQYITANRP